MLKKNISLIAGGTHTKETLHKQLQEYLEDVAQIKSYAIDEGIKDVITDDLIIISSDTAKEEIFEMEKIDKNCEIIVANRTISHYHIDEIVLLPQNTEVLFVNDVKQTAQEGIKALEKLGIDYIKYIPYYPGCNELINNIEVAITPGEVDKVPIGIKQIYDIGPRIMDFTTITKILNKLDIIDQKAGQFSQKFLKKIINVAKRLAISSNEISDLNEHLNLVIDGLNDGLLVYDKEGYISVFNENLKKMLNRGYNKVAGKLLKNVIYNKNLLTFLMDNTVEKGEVFNINDKEMMVHKIQLPKSDSTIVTFKNINEVIENDKLGKELVTKGFYGKYTFEDIVGESEKISHLKYISKKLSRTEITILIEGESGTGKELLASAIHNESKRKKGPFLAVNFSALPDELIESELFGYEEGAFTGAKKGGKAGLFEQANEGTIFLDEIGDISAKVQARLLRVLQEREVMRIGGTDIKSIDVRVIAATNRDLTNLVNNREFRKDLYYRLKMGYIKIPPLRERKEDIIDLMNYFIKTETREDIKISKEVIEMLLKYNWYGNIRELKNILSYMMAVREGNQITLRDIPDESFFQEREIDLEQKDINEDIDLSDEQLYILEKIYQLNKYNKVVGRTRLSEETLGTDYELTKYQMRNRLDELERMGFILKKRGKHGTILTSKGKKYLMVIMGEKMV
ncbi:sigma 54-interacting transcriptional regulator [Clostridium sp. D2Q-11]|uniref:Sigma 54-interacting transcriptional regulator n=1 Tax=Anaeromonas frigoriresistens TaxID=2683708 RepID=A0A942UR52_9FIRM|nr:sigma 54-interacting transcriptional regulator [Anaeromonas frigoriresistens]MBS4537678.1 sigma 54-interacting transcriptional regulator [Anaeromonas frigoriresistens]